jgi:hypothetical protein
MHRPIEDSRYHIALTVVPKMIAALLASFLFVTTCVVVGWNVNPVFFLSLAPGAYLSRLWHNWALSREPWTNIRPGQNPLVPLGLDVLFYWFCFSSVALIGGHLAGRMRGIPPIPRKLRLLGWIVLIAACLYVIGCLIWINSLLPRHVASAGG